MNNSKITESNWDGLVGGSANSGGNISKITESNWDGLVGGSANSGGNISTASSNSPKRNQCEPPGRVLFLRNLARGVNENDLSNLVAPFCQGIHPKLYVQSMKGQAFVEFPSLECASRCLDFLNSHPTPLKGSPVMGVFSSRQSVTTQEDLMSSLEQSSRVLLVHVVEMMYPVDIDMLHHIFCKHGIVEKIVTFSRDQRAFQAMIQFSTPQSATEALRALDSQNIYNDCNTLKIQFSTFKELTVKYNNSRSRDFTNNFLPSGYEDGASWDPHVPQRQLQCRLPSDPRVMSPMANNSGGYISPQGSGGWLQPMSAVAMKLVGSQIGSNALINVQLTPVVIVYGLDPEEVCCDHLFNLFSFYGVVTKVKVLVKRRDAALVQFQLPDYATLALNFLQSATIYGKELRIDFSNNKEITVTPSPNPHDSKTKVYGAKAQRYGMNVHEKTIKNVCRPSPSLHVANVSLDVDESQLLDIFAQHGTPTGFKWLAEKESRKDGPMPVKMALLQMTDVGNATTALAYLHNYVCNDKALKVSFSKQTIS
eukprot:GHVL01007747.1.p1 GENE.GHVL01007747.1~~GHVL01007747.1.p1  ORF type:complete len:538 (+),score=85.68 GHVL01007747.1:66-1679(+)